MILLDSEITLLTGIADKIGTVALSLCVLYFFYKYHVKEKEAWAKEEQEIVDRYEKKLKEERERNDQTTTQLIQEMKEARMLIQDSLRNLSRVIKKPNEKTDSDLINP